jgi:hypothetical protein
VCLQARERTRLVASAKRSRAVEERRRQAGVALSKDEAVTKIQVRVLPLPCFCVNLYTSGPKAGNSAPVTDHSTIILLHMCSWLFWGYWNAKDSCLVDRLHCTSRAGQHGPAKLHDSKLGSLSHAVLCLQSVLRGCLWRSRVRREANQELVFVGMKPQVGCYMQEYCCDMHGLRW